MDLEAYSKNLTDFIAGGYITSAIMIGIDLGLFEQLKKNDGPVTSQQLADACNLKDRYVQEWLGCMVSCRIVSMDASDKYFIPESLKPGLNALGFAFFIPVMDVLTTKVKDCFKKDGSKGFGYTEMPKEVVDAIENKTADPDEAVNQLLKPLPKPLESKATILDLGCGGGNLTRALRKRFKDADIYGADLSETAITKAEALSKSVKNLKFVKTDITRMPADWTRKFDWVILYDVLHDLPDNVNAMKEVHRVLKDDGAVSIVDPNIHSKHRDNIGDANTAGVGYAISSVICLPSSSSIEGAACHGIGWGTENKEAFLKSSGWKIHAKGNVDSPFAYNFTCGKA
ncbi:S-adenosylmethionine-dependent methyltransferase Rv2258c-like [Ylistrum balloti]|uniref:S-adenosylmethionine-dependent methyltransferase Rv2258c-like n=1 Tax=Ylistrum balloti TaxID=509963 RepID=UPI0029058B4E|nr:S-adenosylmethionine-dependent methyltransferase Rv2258c-like [Ylistrum balloti]